MKIEGQVAMRKGFEEEIEKFNKASADKIKVIPYVAGEGRKGILNQTAQLDDALKKAPNVIVIQPTDNSALARGLQEANTKGIPVIAYDQYIVNGNLASFLTSDNYQGGRDNGDYIEKTFEKGSTIRIVVFEYPQVSSTMDRVDGFFDSLREHNRNFKVLKRYQAVDPASGEAAAKQFLKDFPEKGSVDLILTVNDGGGITIVKTLWEKKRTEIRHATFDGDPESVENIKNKRLTIIDSAQFCAELGRETARNLIAYLRKEKVPTKKLVPTFPVTEQSVKDYPGWMGRPSSKYVTVTPEKAPVRVKTAAIPASSSNRVIVKIGVAPLCPYLCEKGPGVWGGYIYDILKDIAQKQGFILQMESIANTRLVSNLLTRKVNYIIVPSYMVRYLPNIRVVGPDLGMSYLGALVPLNYKDSLIDSESIATKKIVYADVGSEGSAEVFSASGGSRVIKLTGSDVADRMIKMINDRRVDLALGDYNLLSYSVGRKAGVNLKLVPTSLTGFSSLVLVSVPKEPEFGSIPQLLHNWFLQARQNGELEGILNKYNLKDWHLMSQD
ncbi:substrate-binding domain-containing protein [Bdellovibrio bacteriovorus]|nr:substrate-binding domain-containing protein [Bdellovibrio bacteriovorus]